MSTPDPVETTDGRRYQPGLFAAFRTRARPVVPATVVTTTGVAPVAGEAVREVVVERPDLKHEEKVAKDAYERGRRDERARHRGSPLLALLVVVIALVGGTMIYLAVQQGSFARGGQVADQTIGQAAAPAKSAADSAGSALENAGQSLKQTAGSQPASNTP